MTPPLPMSCSSPNCVYETPANIPSYELVLKALDIHVQSAHSKLNETPSNGKAEKLKRPTVNSNMSESDWTFYIHKWDRYKRQASLSGQNLLDEMWACLNSEIERLAFQAT